MQEEVLEALHLDRLATTLVVLVHLLLHIVEQEFQVLWPGQVIYLAGRDAQVYQVSKGDLFFREDAVFFGDLGSSSLAVCS